MHALIEVVLGVLMVFTGFMAVESKNIIRAIIYLSFLSMLAVVGFVLMKAPDVAVTEAVIGSGLVTALFIFTLMATKGEKAGDEE